MKVAIEDRNDDGRGRGHAGQRAVLVSQAHPGETVSVRVDRKTRGTLQGRVAQVFESDPGRIEHNCRHEFKCTGCSMLAAPVVDEARFKHEKVARLLHEALGEAVVVDPVITPAGPFHYRHYAKQVFGEAHGRVWLGSYVAGTHTVVDNRACPVLTEPLAQMLQKLVMAVEKARLPLHGDSSGGLRYVMARHGRSSGQLMVIVASSSPEHAALEQLLPDAHSVWALHNDDPGNVLMSGTLTHVSGAQNITEELAGFEHTLGPRSFFQVNPAAAEVVVEVALQMAGAGQVCVEGFSGAGALTLPLSKKFERVVAVENSPDATEDLRRSAKAAALAERIVVECADATERLPALWQEHHPAALVLDPPRKGLGEKLADAVAASGVPKVVLVSCAPEALARDLPRLRRGGYRVDRVVPIDQFPRTGHVETVVALHTSD